MRPLFKMKKIWCVCVLCATVSMPVWASPENITAKPAPSGFTAVETNQRNQNAASLVSQQNNLQQLITAEKKKPTDTTINSQTWSITYLPSGQINTLSTINSGSRLTIAYAYFKNGDIMRKSATEQFSVHGVPVRNTVNTNYGYDSRGRSVILTVTTTDTNGHTTLDQTYHYHYSQNNLREFSVNLGTNALTKGCDTLDSKGRVVEHTENTTYSGTFNPLSEKITDYHYEGDRVIETVYDSRLVNGKQLTARQVQQAHLPPNEVNDYRIVKKVRVEQTARFYFYDVNGTHLIETRFVYQ